MLILSNFQANPTQIVLGSQTIHASLDNDLNNSGLDENDLTVAETDGAASETHGTGKLFEKGSPICPVATQPDKVVFSLLNSLK